MTSITIQDTAIEQGLRFSLMEALYSRGFTKLEQIQKLSLAQFQRALAGSVAQTDALSSAIYALTTAGIAGQQPTGLAQDGFASVNSSGSLANYTPPPHLSPLGQAAYLHDMLGVALGDSTVGTLVAARRGSIQALRPSTANVSTPVPSIDLVNESLEALGSNLDNPCGAVYDASGGISQPRRVSSNLLHEAIPDHSSPAKSAQPGVYKDLQKCFTDPSLPYSQSLDFCSSNLAVLGSNRFDILSHFRKEITELPGDATLEPDSFQRHVWRYPVRLEIALAFLNITPDEYATLFTSTLASGDFLVSVLGVRADEIQNGHFFTVKRFLDFTELSYNQFSEFQETEFVPFDIVVSGKNGLQGADSSDLNFAEIHFQAADGKTALAFQKSIVFIRLWQCLARSSSSQTQMMTLVMICTTLGLFKSEKPNPSFVRQIAAVLLLRERFGVPLEQPVNGMGSVLSIWDKSWQEQQDQNQGVDTLLEKVEAYSRSRFDCQPRPAGFQKDVKENLHQLSLLAGFTAQDTWYANPTSTIRFAEVLSKIFASNFTVGELIFLFTVESHAAGDDPFALPDALDSTCDPFNNPEDADNFNLWQLRKKLIDVSEEIDKREWSWTAIRSFLIEIGYEPLKENDPLTLLGEHFFPQALEACNHHVHARARRFQAALPPTDTTASLWSADQGDDCAPFRYDVEGEGILWTELPLTDNAVLEKLQRTRQLRQVEIAAVQELYFAPRQLLAPFATIFRDFKAAEDVLIHEPSERKRFEFFQQQFHLFHHRYQVIADHLADHVAAATGVKNQDGRKAAWQILKVLPADELSPSDGASWEDDEGAGPKAYSWPKTISSGSLGALLGLVGTGLIGQYEVSTVDAARIPVWREKTGNLSFFGDDRNETNVVVPTILPALRLPEPDPQQQPSLELVNGFALRDSDEHCLGGAQPFKATWSGALLVETSGDYSFHVGNPKPGNESPEFTGAKHQRWRVGLRRGQKSWTILNHCWKGATTATNVSEPLRLQRGAWHIDIEFEQLLPSHAHHVHLHTGFQVKYKGPDTGDELQIVPSDRLFAEAKHEQLGHGLDLGGSAAKFLSGYYYSTLRDIRRTYQRAFKGLLFAHRHSLSPEPARHEPHGDSELAFILGHPSSFAGASYYREAETASKLFRTHRSNLDLQLLPVSDPYRSPSVSEDSRAHPSPKRQAALFDWWERLHDYTQLRRWVHHTRGRQCWVLFYEASEQAPGPDKLLRYLSVSTALSAGVLSYLDRSSNRFDVGTADLTDERWTTRVWRAGVWIAKLKERFWSKNSEQIRPWLWSAEDPSAPVSGGTSGNDNLTHFVQQSHFDQKSSAVQGIIDLNNGLRSRARKALLTYLCGGNRVALPYAPNTVAQLPRDLSSLLLQDVEVPIGQKTTRIADAISSVQALVQRVRLGLEAGVRLAPEFPELWDSKYVSFEKWEAVKRRELYPENWIQWEELHSARHSKSFQLLEEQLKKGVLTVPKPSGSFSWQNEETPNSALKGLQALELCSITEDGASLIGQPERAGQLSLVAPFNPLVQPHSLSNGPSDVPDDKAPPSKGQFLNSQATGQLPLWEKATAELGTSFIRVAAASRPVAELPSRGKGQFRCSTSQSIYPQTVDEFFFWLTPAQTFNKADAPQDMNLGAKAPDPSCDWDPIQGKLPGLLRWQPRPVYYLNWSRVRLGQSDTGQQSDEGVIYVGQDPPSLQFLGRKADFLLFSVNNVESFQYDMALDSAAVLEAGSKAVATIDMSKFPAPLAAYPFFLHFEPGVPLIPLSNFSIALSITSVLRSKGYFEEAQRWCKLAFERSGSPLHGNNTWSQSHPAPPLPVAAIKDKAALLESLELLLQWGESLGRGTDPMSHRRALVLFSLVDKILGRRPRQVLLEDKSSDGMTIANFVPSAVPLNSRLLKLYDALADKLAQLYEGSSPGIDKFNTSLAKGLCFPSINSPHARHPYRFAYLLAKAQELAQQVCSLGSTLLTALERGDYEYLTSLQTRHERQLIGKTLEGKKEQFRASDWEVQALEASLRRSMGELTFTQSLVRNGNNAQEIGFQVTTGLSLAGRTAAMVALGIGEGLSNVPDVFVGGAGIAGSPLEFQRIVGGSSLAAALNFAASMLTQGAESANTLANMLLVQSGWDRRKEEWLQQTDVLAADLRALEAQKLAADRRRDIALAELNTTQRQIEHLADVQAFVRDKTTGFDLYLYLQREAAVIYRQSFDLASAAAREAQDMLRYELRPPPWAAAAVDFLSQDGTGPAWNGLHRGLLAGEQLALALRAMDLAYAAANAREHELTKQLSLALHFPAALLALKATGRCTFTVPEWMFDLDHPGHYMRRLRGVSISVPCAVGPYAGVHARLELGRSTIRVDPSVGADGDDYECADPERDTRFAHLYGSREAIATSHGAGDAGVWELSFRDERCLPFEFAGAVAEWTLELPAETNAFDPVTLTDVVLSVSYTAREGGAALRRAASTAARKRLPGAGERLFDVRNEFGGAWALLERLWRRCRGEVGKLGRPELALPFHSGMFPFLTGRRVVRVVRLQVFLQTTHPVPPGSHMKVWYDAHGGDGEKEVQCDCCGGSQRTEFDCVVHAEWPELYHGVLDVAMEVPLMGAKRGSGDCGFLRFPQHMSEMRDIYVLCHYEVQEMSQKGSRHPVWAKS